MERCGMIKPEAVGGGTESRGKAVTPKPVSMAGMAERKQGKKAGAENKKPIKNCYTFYP
jgi:hypothetical protein